MGYKYIMYDKDGYVAKVTLNRPNKMNAISVVMEREIDNALTEAEEDDDVKVLVIKGAGQCFTSGHDLNEVGFIYGFTEPKPGERAHPPSQRVRLKTDRRAQGENLKHVLLCQKIIIAQCHGYCLGEGLMIAEKCDLIIGSNNCKFGFTEERLGTGGMTMSPILVLRVGLTKALELQITGRMIDGQEAERIHLINKAVPEDQLEDYVNNLAQGIALYSRDGIAIAKACRHAVYDQLGVNNWWNTAYLTHTLMTNMRWESDEYNFYKMRKDKGVREAAHGKDDFYKALDKF